MGKITEKPNKDYVEPWWKCGKSDSEWFNFFNNIQNSGCNITREQFEEFFNKKTGVDKNGMC